MIFVVFIILLIVFVILPIIGWALWLIITTLVVGLVVGFLGRLILPGHNPIGVLPTIACGIIGSVVGGAVGRGASVGRFATVLIEIAIAAVAVAVWSGVSRRGVRH